MTKYKRIIVAGKGGSGKDHLVKLLKEQGFSYSVSHTSRPPRDGEIEGSDYYFIPYGDAIRMSNENKFYEWVIFNDWFYGTSLEEFHRANLFIMTPSGIGKLKPEDRKESYIIFIDIEENVRKERLSMRRDADSVGRRLEEDKKDFEGFSDFDCIITNPNFNLEEVLEKIKDTQWLTY